jgi:hypothetical protein
MSALAIHFEGWFQCRLAVNPDPSDEPRGVSGYTFAVAGEPDLDRVIRWQHPVAPRSHAPTIGVRVSSVELAGTPQPDHGLLGAAVDLLGQPRFESRNRLLSEDRAGVAFIEPFELMIECRWVTIRRKDILYPSDPTALFHTLPPSALNRRGPLRKDGMIFDPVRVASATGIRDASAYRAARKNALIKDLSDARDEVTRAALQKRIHELSIDEPTDQRTMALGLTQNRRFDLNGPASIVDPEQRLSVACDCAVDWPIEFWMGAWDADGLCGFVQGLLKIPLRADSD